MLSLDDAGSGWDGQRAEGGEEEVPLLTRTRLVPWSSEKVVTDGQITNVVPSHGMRSIGLSTDLTPCFVAQMRGGEADDSDGDDEDGAAAPEERGRE
jgi:hypothetical protein